MWDGLDRKVRNQVRKAQKSGLTAERGGTALLDAFYAVFARNMRDLGTPLLIHQPSYSMLNRWIEAEGLLDAAEEVGAGVIGFTALAQGLLTGKYQRDQGVADGRWQEGKDNFNREATELAWDVIDVLRELAAAKDCTVSQLALAWCGAQPGVTAPIIGPRTFDQAADNLGSVDVTLEPADFERLDALVPPRSAAVRYYDGAGFADFRTHQHRSVV